MSEPNTNTVRMSVTVNGTTRPITLVGGLALVADTDRWTAAVAVECSKLFGEGALTSNLTDAGRSWHYTTAIKPLICHHWREYTEFPGRAIGWVESLSEDAGTLTLQLDGTARTFTIPAGAELLINQHTFSLARLMAWWDDESPPDGSDTSLDHTRLAADLECDDAGVVSRACLFTRP